MVAGDEPKWVAPVHHMRGEHVKRIWVIGPDELGSVVEPHHECGVRSIFGGLMQLGDEVGGRAASGRRHGVLLIKEWVRELVREGATAGSPPIALTVPHRVQTARAGARRVTRFR